MMRRKKINWNNPNSYKPSYSGQSRIIPITAKEMEKFVKEIPKHEYVIKKMRLI